MSEKDVLVKMLTRIGHHIDIFDMNNNMQTIDDDTTAIRYVFDKNGRLINCFSI